MQTGTNINFFDTLNKNSEKAKENYPYIIEYYRKKLESKESEIIQMKAKISSMQSFNNRKRNSSIIRDNYMNYGSYLKEEIHKRSKSQNVNRGLTKDKHSCGITYKSNKNTNNSKIEAKIPESESKSQIESNSKGLQKSNTIYDSYSKAPMSEQKQKVIKASHNLSTSVSISKADSNNKRTSK